MRLHIGPGSTPLLLVACLALPAAFAVAEGCDPVEHAPTGEGEGEGAGGEGEGEGEGAAGEGEGEGSAGEGEGEGAAGEGEGEGEGAAGEGEGEGEGEGAPALTADGLVARVLAGVAADEVQAIGREHGWPVLLDDGTFLVVSLRADRAFFAGDVNGFTPQAMNVESGVSGFRFAWLVVNAAPGSRYKLVSDAGGSVFEADVNGRTYGFDGNGEMTLFGSAGVDRTAYPKLYQRFFDVSLPNQSTLRPRNVRVLIPSVTAARALYVHDGQNVFARDSSIPDGFVIPDGGWRLDESAPADTMVVAIDNTPDRFFDYTHVPDTIDLGSGPVSAGGGGDLYADFVVTVVKPLIAAEYGQPPVAGLMGSSLGGLVSLHINDRYPNAFDLVAGLSSTFGWGSFSNVGPNDGDQTMIDRYAAAAVRHAVIYVDSGGDAGTGCFDSDGDGIFDDDLEADDNFCETAQMRDTLAADGYVLGADLVYFFDPGPDGVPGGTIALHTESAWEFRARTQVFPLLSSL